MPNCWCVIRISLHGRPDCPNLKRKKQRGFKGSGYKPELQMRYRQRYHATDCSTALVQQLAGPFSWQRGKSVHSSRFWPLKIQYQKQHGIFVNISLEDGVLLSSMCTPFTTLPDLVVGGGLGNTHITQANLGLAARHNSILRLQPPIAYGRVQLLHACLKVPACLHSPFNCNNLTTLDKKCMLAHPANEMLER